MVMNYGSNTSIIATTLEVGVEVEVVEVEGSGSWISALSQTRWSTEESKPENDIVLVSEFSFTCFLCLVTGEPFLRISGAHLEAFNLMLWQRCKVGSGFCVVASPSTKCTLQTQESLLGIQRVQLRVFLLIFLAHCNLRLLFFFSDGNRKNWNGGWQSHGLKPFLQPWSLAIGQTICKRNTSKYPRISTKNHESTTYTLMIKLHPKIVRMPWKYHVILILNKNSENPTFEILLI